HRRRHQLGRARARRDLRRARGAAVGGTRRAGVRGRLRRTARHARRALPAGTGAAAGGGPEELVAGPPARLRTLTRVAVVVCPMWMRAGEMMPVWLRRPIGPPEWPPDAPGRRQVG